MAQVLSKEAYALLDAIAKSESAGAWNVIYGGSTFDDYSDHPREYVPIKSGPNKGLYSSAAGKYQILASTYDRVAPLLGITDFSPESQLQIAYYLAQEADPQLEQHLADGDLATISKELKSVWTSLPGGIEQGQNSQKFLKNYNTALSAPVPPGLLGDDARKTIESIHDRQATAQGYGEIAPNVGSGRPAYFNETGAPPIPATRPTAKVTPATISPALQAARQRLQLAREAKTGTAATGTTTPAAMAATPRLTQANGEITGIDDPRAPLDWGQFRPGVGVGGVGSLLDGGINPAALNPAQSTTTVAGRPDAPVGALPAARPTTTVATRPDAPVGSLPAASPAESKEAQRSTGNTEPTPTPQTRQPTMGTLKGGKQVEIGKSYIVGDKLMIAEPGPNGTATLRDVEDVRDDWLRQNVDPNAPLLLENSLAGTAARAIAAPAIKQGVNTAVGNATKAIGDTANSLVDTATGLYDQAIVKLGSLSKPKASTTGNTLTSTFVSEDHEKSNKPVPYIKPLVPSTTGNTLAKPAAPSMVKTTIANPDYAAWVAKYGDGSQVQTAPTGGMITANQLAAISGSGAPVPAAKPAIPSAPPRTITVMRPGNTLAPTPAAPKVQTAQTVSGKTVNVGQTYQSGGYLYTANANGTFTKIGKVGGSSSSGVLSSLSTSPSKSSTTTRVTTGTNVSGDQNAFSPQSVQSSERWQTGY